MGEYYVIAVSGGVDSVVLLDRFQRRYSPSQLVVAHFDHGIRPESDADARFVEGLAAHYGLRFELGHGRLGANASEAVAREARYAFLKGLAAKYSAKLVTAHHSDDVAETIAVNIVRGTGWRGLAVMSDSEIYRPLTSYTKQQLVEYAHKNRLEWVEDETNYTDAYLRNVIRRLTSPNNIQAAQLGNLRSRQLIIKDQIESEAKRILAANTGRRRYFLTQVDPVVADEMLRQILIKAAGTPLTRPQRSRMLTYIKVGKPGSMVELGEGVTMTLKRGEFEVKSTNKP